jgi:hypothetical protein
MSMRWTVAILLAWTAGGLGGCASTVTAFKNDPFIERGFQKQALYTMTGERRFAFAVLKESNPLRFCAESLPDTATAASGATTASLKPSEVVSASLDDKFSTSLTQTFVRTEIAEVFRQMGFQACQAWAQEVLSKDEYKTELTRMISAGIEVIKNRSTQPLPTVADAGAPKPPTGAPTPTPSPSGTPSPAPSPSPTASPIAR